MPKYRPDQQSNRYIAGKAPMKMACHGSLLSQSSTKWLVAVLTITRQTSATTHVATKTDGITTSGGRPHSRRYT